MHTMNKTQSLSLRSRRLGLMAAAVLSLAACMPAASSGHAYAGLSLPAAGSENAVSHRHLSELDANFGLAGSANAVEHRYLSHLDVAGSANAVEHRFLTHFGAATSGAGSTTAAERTRGR